MANEKKRTSRFGCLLRFLIVAIIASGVMFVVKSCACTPDKTAGMEKYQQIAPDRIKAPYVLQTITRVYYVSSFKEDSTTYTLQEYYTYDAKKWKFQDTPLPIEKKQYGQEVKLYVRKD